MLGEVFGVCVKLTTRLFFVEMQSAVKQNLHLETEADINKLANLLLGASYTYLSLVRLATLPSSKKAVILHLRLPLASPGHVF